MNEVDRELSQPGRLFSFLGCHDRNMSALLHALGVTDYALADTLETRIPIGSKILFERWEADDGGQFMNIRIVYATTEQLRHLVRLTLDNPPASHDLEFASIERNADGLFALKDVADLFEEKLDYHDEILNTYEGEAELDNAA